MEFGYVEAPHKSFPVVFDSPRDRGLKEFSYNRILVCGKGQSGKPLGGSCYRTRSVLPSPGPLGGKRTQVVGYGKWGVSGRFKQICK